MEFVDIVDEKGNLTGEKNPRGEVHKNGLLHVSIHILIYNSKHQILLQKRALVKDFDAGKWDFLLGGHVSAGETPEITVLKELKEEYGIEVNFKDLEFLKTRRFFLKVPEQSWYDNEINPIYLLRFDGDIRNLELQKEEVSDVRWITLDELESDIKNPIKNQEYCSHKDYSYYFEMINLMKERLK